MESSRKTTTRIAESDSRFVNFNRKLGARISGMRRTRGLSQEQLGALLGVRPQQIQKYESGINRFSIVQLMCIAEAFDVSLHELIDGIVEGYTFPMSGIGADIVSVADQNAGTEHRRSILDIVRALQKIQNPEVLANVNTLIGTVLTICRNDPPGGDR